MSKLLIQGVLKFSQRGLGPYVLDNEAGESSAFFQFEPHVDSLECSRYRRWMNSRTLILAIAMPKWSSLLHCISLVFVSDVEQA